MSDSSIDYNDEKIRFFVPLVEGKSVLDLGVVQHQAGRYHKGSWLHRAIQKHSAKCLGVDIDSEGVRFLRRQGFNVIEMDAQNLVLDDQYDVVVAGDIVEHLDNLQGLLCSVKRHLKRQGVFVISTPNPFWWKTWLMVLIKGSSMAHEQHTCWFCERTLAQLLLREGFAVQQIKYRSIYDLTSIFHRLTKLINCIMPLPERLKHNTMMVVAYLHADTECYPG